MEDPRAYAIEINKVEELDKIPDKSIVWYPSQTEDYGGFMTGRSLKLLIEECHTEESTPELKRSVKKDLNELDGDSFILKNNDFVMIEITSDTIGSVMSVNDDGLSPLQELQLFIENAEDLGYVFYRVPYVRNPGDDYILACWNYD